MKPNHVRKASRLQEYDYSEPGAYFITICTKNREHHFGAIQNDVIVLSETGKIAERCWKEVPQHFPEIELDEFVIMPNHIHGIISILENQNTVGDGRAHPLPEQRPHQKIPVIIRSFKSAVTKEIYKIFPNHSFSWQRSCHDHIIRSETDLELIREYIAHNPLNWKADRENK